MTITKADYPQVLKAIEQKHIIELDLNGPPANVYDLNDTAFTAPGGWLGLGSFDNWPATQHLLPGNITTKGWKIVNKGLNLNAEKVKQFKPVTLNTGAAGLEITYYPLQPWGDTIKDTFNKTTLSTLMTLAEFTKDAENEEDWVKQCFGQIDCYDILLEVEPLGTPTRLNPNGDYEFGEPFCNPIPVTFNGVNYQIYSYWNQD